MVKKQYESVSQLIDDIAPDEEMRKAFNARISERALIKELLVLRAVKGFSQKDIAQAIGCSQSRISKLENAKDVDAKLGDLRAYADAVGCELPAWPMPRDMKPTDKVKCHTFAIKKHMNDLAQLAKSDEKIVEGVASFFHELFVNFTLMLGESAKRLPLRPDDSPYFDLQLGCYCQSANDARQKCCVEANVEENVEVAS